MLTFRILCIVSMIICFFSVIILIIQGFLRNKYFHDYKQDELLKETKSVNSRNKIYFTSGETRKYIKRYALCKSAYDEYLICDYNQKYKDITYYIIAYGKRRIKGVFYITQSNTDITSKIISLPSTTKTVNIIIKSVNGVDINTNVIRPLSIKKIRIYSLIASIAYFTFLFSLRHILVELFAGPYIYTFSTSIYNYLIILAIFIFSIMNYWFTSHTLRRKNSKYTSGGSLEYEFF